MFDCLTFPPTLNVDVDVDGVLPLFIAEVTKEEDDDERPVGARSFLGAYPERGTSMGEPDTNARFDEK